MQSAESISTEEKVMRIKIGCRSKSEDEICGDTATWCSLPQGKKALILSDGMGKGEAAALCSQKAVRKLRVFLKNGFSPRQALRAANDFIIEQKKLQIIREDDFATIDLAVIDYTKGKVYFYKMGAAWSFLVRGKKVLKIHENTLPAGIVREIGVHGFAKDIMPGDMIVMASDGVTEADREDFEGKWLEELLAFEGEKVKRGSEERPRAVATQILNMAIKRRKGYEEDDMTVLVAIVKEELDVKNK